MWENGSVTIAFVPSGDQGQSLLDLARQWTQESLLSSAIWVRPEDVTILPGEPPVIRAIVMATTASRALIEREVDLFEVLARERLSLLRLIKVRSALPDRALDAVQDAVSDEVSTYVGYSMPLTVPGVSSASERTELLRVSLICAPTDFQLRERVEWASTDSSVLVVASPEDRATPQSGDAFVRDNGRFIGFVLMHLATVGGLWSGMPTGWLELFDREGSAAQSIWIPRVFVSGVLTDGLAQRTSAQVLAEIVENSGAISATGGQLSVDGTAVIPREITEGYVDQLVSHAMMLDDSALAFHRPNVEEERPREEISIPRQLASFFEFSRGKLIRVPHWFRLWFHDRVARRLDRGLQGAEGLRTVELRLDRELDARDRMLVEASERVSASREEIQRTAGGGSPSTRRTTPRLWSGLRAMLFGSLDGSSDLKDFGFIPIEGRQPVLGAVSDVAPDARDVWTYPGTPRPRTVPPTVSWRQLRDRPEIEAELVKARDTADATLAASRDKMAAAAAEQEERLAAVAALETRLLDAGALTYGEDGTLAPAPAVLNSPEFDTGPNLSEDEVEPAGGTVGEQGATSAADESAADVAAYLRAKIAADAQRRRCDELERLVDAAMSAQQHHEDAWFSFHGWAGRARRSFVWKLLERLDAQRSANDTEIEDAQKRQAEVPDPGHLVLLRKKFHRGLCVALPIIFGLAVIVIALPYLASALVGAGSVPPPVQDAARSLLDAWLAQHYPAWWITVICAVVAFVVTINVFLAAYYRGWSAFERQVQIAEQRIFVDDALVRALGGEKQRLSSVHAQTDQWLETIATALYGPWSVPDTWLQSGVGRIDASRLPFAMHIAQVGSGSGSGGERLKLAAASELLRAGWRAEAFADMVDAVRRRLGLESDRFGLDALDNDLPDASNNSRARLRSLMTDPNVLEEIAVNRLDKLVKGLQEGSLYSAATEVEVLDFDPLEELRSGDDRSGPDTCTWRQFLTQMLGTESDVPTPLSPLGIASHEIQRAFHESVTSYIQAPELIATDLSRGASERVNVRSHQASGGSFDVVTRVDMVGPVPVSAIKLWSAESPRPGGATTSESGLVAPRCRECGRTDCPAAVPGSTVSCAYSGI